MGSMFRSEKMALCQLFIQPEAAYASVSAMGEAGIAQFRDLNGDMNAFQRKFVQEVKRCNEMERQLRYIEAEVRKDEITIIETLDEIPLAPNPREIIGLESLLEKTENEIRELSHNHVSLKSNYLELTELGQVLEKAHGFFSEQEVINLETASEDGGKGVGQNAGSLAFVAGVIQRERVIAFERMLWRVSRGNVFLRRADLDEPLKDPATGHPIYKTVFVAFFQGEQLKNGVKKVCSGFHASLYPCPSVNSERDEMYKGVRTRLEDLKMVLNQTEDHRRRALVIVAKELPVWTVMVKKMKAIYHTLNLCNMDVSQKCLIAECWVPYDDLSIVQTALRGGSSSVGSSIAAFLNVIDTNEQPPTFNRTNKFTQGFQNLIDSYGVATYRETNPALYTIVTFPFLFGVMFGDFGHGMILFLFALYMVLSEKKIAKMKIGEIGRLFFGGRYIILLMGLFALYTGFIYNDIFSRSVNIFGSSWRVNYNTSTIMENKLLTLNPTEDARYEPYVAGVDPVWQLAGNKIIFSNSFKMKLSIIFGVVHMMFGVTMSLINDLHFRRPINIVLNFLPQIIFLVLMFGYMVVMMFMKWLLYNSRIDTEPSRRQGCAPSILIMFINMVLFKSSEPLPGCKEFMFEGQDIVQMVIVLVSLLCIPWLLLAKPIYILCTRNMKKPSENVHQADFHVVDDSNTQEGFQSEAADSELDLQSLGMQSVRKGNSQAAAQHGDDHEGESMGEVFILQAIHTIEYILSTVSHTASYLRLWALSLAHAQLSDVLWSKLLSMGLTVPGYVGAPVLFVLFTVWAGLTVGIMVLIESLSAFLHTLRLHWVEFMSKFYSGLGYAFMPFSFKAILEGEEGDEAKDK